MMDSNNIFMIMSRIFLDQWIHFDKYFDLRKYVKRKKETGPMTEYLSAGYEKKIEKISHRAW